MGDRGPLPKPEATRRRRNKDSQFEQIDPLVDEVVWPEPDDDWHPVARMFWDSLQDSAQAQFYEPSDVAVAWTFAENISRQHKPQVVGVNPVSGEAIFGTVPANGAQLSAWLKLCHDLLLTAGARRRFRVEVDRSSNVEPDPDVPNIDDYRKRAGFGS